MGLLSFAGKIVGGAVKNIFPKNTIVGKALGSTRTASSIKKTESATPPVSNNIQNVSAAIKQNQSQAGTGSSSPPSATQSKSSITVKTILLIAAPVLLVVILIIILIKHE